MKTFVSQYKSKIKEWEKQLAAIDPSKQPTLYANIQKNIQYYSKGGSGYADEYRDWQLAEAESKSKELGITPAQLVTNPELANDPIALAEYKGIK